MSPSSPGTRHVCAGCHKELLWPGGPVGSSEPLELEEYWSPTCVGASEGGSYAWNGRCEHEDGVGDLQPGQSAVGFWRSATASGVAALKKILRTVAFCLCRRRAADRH